VLAGVRISRLGNKSLVMDYRLADAETGQEFAAGSSVIVTYDYPSERTIPIPDSWREVIAEFEGLSLDS
jgi:acyl-CoA thioesterase FadM